MRYLLVLILLVGGGCCHSHYHCDTSHKCERVSLQEWEKMDCPPIIIEGVPPVN